MITNCRSMISCDHTKRQSLGWIKKKFLKSLQKILMVFQGLIIQMQHFILSLQKERSVIKTVPRSGVSRKQCLAFFHKDFGDSYGGWEFPDFPQDYGAQRQRSRRRCRRGQCDCLFFFTHEVRLQLLAATFHALNATCPLKLLQI